MIDFDEYNSVLRKSTNFESLDNFDDGWFIIKETSLDPQHSMLIGEVFKALREVYDDLSVFDQPDLYDLLEYEKELWTKT